MRGLATVATTAWLASALPEWLRFRRSLGDPEGAQRRVLARILRRAEGSAFAREHGLDRHTPLEGYRARVPARTWAELGPWLDRAVAGEAAVLTAGPVTRFEPTSGTTTARKLVPSTAAGRRELAAGVGAWVVDTYRRDPPLAGGPAYWSISPALPRETTPGGVPIGFDDDAGYLGGVAEHLVRRALVRGAPGLSGEAFWRSTVRALLGARGLRLISIWNPSFGVLLSDAVRRHWDDALRTLPAPVARAVEAAGPERPWPHLRLLSTWTDGAAAMGLDALRARFPGVPIQEKGLLATEGIVSLPFAGTHPMALTSHFLELARDDGALVPLHSAAPGDEGRVVLTTGSGLWRYHLDDRIRVTGRLHATPTVRFLGRAGRVSDTRGEKLSEPFVAAVLRRLGVAGFAMLAPEDGGYVLFAEHPPDAGALESALADNPHYAWAVSLGQLAPVRTVRVGADAGARCIAARGARGQRLGDVKPTALETTGGWSAVFSAAPPDR